MTQFYEHGYDLEQVHGRNMVEAARTCDVKHVVWSTVEGREGECSAISWTSKALIEDRFIEAGIPWTFVYIPMYYENFFSPFFPPTYDDEKGFGWAVTVPPDLPIYAMSVEEFGGWVVPAFVEPEKYTGESTALGHVVCVFKLSGVKIKICVEYLSFRDVVTQFSDVTGEKAYVALELDREQFEATRHADHPLAETLYLSFEFITRSGPGTGVKVSLRCDIAWNLNSFSLQSVEQTISINPAASTYRQWLKSSQGMRDYISKMKEDFQSKKTA